MSTLKIEIELSGLGLEQDPETGELYPGASLADQIVEAILKRMQRDGERSIGEIAADKARDTAEKITRERVAELLAGPINRTDYYGNVKETTTIEEMAMAAFDKWVRPGDSRSNYGGNNRGTMGELVEQIVKKEAEAMVKPIVEGAKKQITGELIRQASEAAAAVLVKQVVRP